MIEFYISIRLELLGYNSLLLRLFCLKIK